MQAGGVQLGLLRLDGHVKVGEVVVEQVKFLMATRISARNRYSVHIQMRWHTAKSASMTYNDWRRVNEKPGGGQNERDV